MSREWIKRATGLWVSRPRRDRAAVLDGDRPRLTAAFDFDATLAPCRGTGPAASRTAPQLAKLALAGVDIVIASNRAGEGRLSPITEYLVAVDKLIADLAEISDALKPPGTVSAYASTDNGRYRKPCTGMFDAWREDAAAELVSAGFTAEPRPWIFYAGDAGGRPQDFAHSDYAFALNIGVPYITPEAFFDPAAADRPLRDRLTELLRFDPARHGCRVAGVTGAVVPEDDESLLVTVSAGVFVHDPAALAAEHNNEPVAPPAVVPAPARPRGRPRKEQQPPVVAPVPATEATVEDAGPSEPLAVLASAEANARGKKLLVIFCGSPGAGKSRIAAAVAAARPRAVLISNDITGTKAKSLKLFKTVTAAGTELILVDNTHPFVEDRAALAETGHKCGYAVEVWHVTTPKDQAAALVRWRVQGGGKAVPAVAIHTYWKRLEPPQPGTDPDYVYIRRIPFVLGADAPDALFNFRA